MAITANEDGNYLMQVRDPYLNIAARMTKNTELSKGEVKTLAYIARKEGDTGVMQSQLIRALGPNAYNHIHDLMEKRFVNAAKKGRSKVLNTTAKFREYFKVPGL